MRWKIVLIDEATGGVTETGVKLAKHEAMQLAGNWSLTLGENKKIEMAALAVPAHLAIALKPLRPRRRRRIARNFFWWH